MLHHLWPVVLWHHPQMLIEVVLGMAQACAITHVWLFPPLKGITDEP